MNNVKLMYDIDATPQFIIEEGINEATGLPVKKYKIIGPYSTIGERNRNGRTYPYELWESEISNYQTNIQKGSINTLMEWEHPARTIVDPMEAVAKIISLKIKDKYVMGEAVLLENQKANKIKSLIDNGIKISVSSRAVGSVKNGIVENFKLVTYDLVTEPSDYNATMNGLVESFQLNEGIINDLSFNLNEDGSIAQFCGRSNILDFYNRKDIDSAIKSKFEEVFNKLRNKSV